MKTVLESVLFVFKLCGIYMEENEGKWYKVKRLLFAIYSIFICVFIWADNVRLLIIMAIEDDIRRQLSFLVFVLMYIIISFYYTLFLRLMNCKLPAILKAFQNYHEEYDLTFDSKRWRKNIKILSVVSVLIYGVDVVGGTVIYNMSFLSEKSILNMQLYPANQISNQGIYLSMVFFVLLKLIYTIAFHNYLIIFFCIISRVITKEYIHVTEKIKTYVKHLTDDEFYDSTEISSIRKHHTAITDLMTATNDVMKHIAAIQYSVTIPIVCLILYGLIHGKLVTEDITILSFNIILHFLIMILITHLGSKLSEEVCR
ncbi:hypothetical protein FSP39_018559 [Pinctada imbricata]|uniref:Gustatory receptor n=1 Tax=Pinctada imbricata TaxID=66713 RepID=A0AA88XT52_PINIB|nr:hypothetical protein FSP39_018559 [Pinctada imbricata]